MVVKRIVCISSLLCFITILFLCFNYDTTNFSGSMFEDGKEINVDIDVNNRVISKIIKQMSGNVLIQTEDDKYFFEYKFYGPTYKSEDCYFVSIMGYDKNRNRYDGGYLYFDDKLQNIILGSSDRVIYAADDKFKNVVAEYDQPVVQQMSE